MQIRAYFKYAVACREFIQRVKCIQYVSCKLAATAAEFKNIHLPEFIKHLYTLPRQTHGKVLRCFRCCSKVTMPAELTEAVNIIAKPVFIQAPVHILAERHSTIALN